MLIHKKSHISSVGRLIEVLIDEPNFIEGLLDNPVFIEGLKDKLNERQEVNIQFNPYIDNLSDEVVDDIIEGINRAGSERNHKIYNDYDYDPEDI